MKVLSAFLFLSSALAQRNNNGGNDNVRLAEVADTPAVSVASLQASAGAAETAADMAATAEDSAQSNGAGASYTPLFDFDLAPYNVALDIVADALEKLADTMEPLDVPLPMVGPGYYLEVQVKSPKNHNGSPPVDQINSVSIEGGQAQPVTEIDIILPGNSAVHQTILVPVDGQETPNAESPSDEPESLGDVSVPVSIPDPEPEDVLSSGSEVSPADTVQPVSDSYLTPPIPAGTESANAPLTNILPELSGSDLVQSISPEAPTAMNTVSGLEPFGETETQPAETSAVSSSSFADGSASNAFGLSQEESAASSNAASEPSSIAEPLSEDELEHVTGGSYELSVSLEDNSLSLGSASSSEAAESVATNTADPWIGLFPTVSSSAPGALSLDSTSAAVEQSQLEPEDVSSAAGDLSSDVIASEVQEEVDASSKEPWGVEDASQESDDVGSVDDDYAPSPFGSASVDSDVTMASAPLPFPPFGGPQTQQPPVGGLNYAISTQSEPTDIPNADVGNAVETIDIVDASDENALESSIDAVLHSVIQDYRTASTPKAAVGFALIHPRSLGTQQE
ncbi:hypothetical protein H4R20_001149 [Coemansia guatemalensis]|uniref:Uncharacterized protein n=1 Tax=Coemansia guatemalensis TaxID=2761395 RepID=A0A9W8HXK1_9FUNG|nr:hypothetical protein H4R20_001149 [Coemansia guatemalensis]